MFSVHAKKKWNCYDATSCGSLPFPVSRKNIDLETMKHSSSSKHSKWNFHLQLKRIWFRSKEKWNSILASAHSCCWWKFDNYSYLPIVEFHLINSQCEHVISWLDIASQLCVPIIYGFLCVAGQNQKKKGIFHMSFRGNFLWNFQMLRDFLTWLLDLLHFNRWISSRPWPFHWKCNQLKSLEFSNFTFPFRNQPFHFFFFFPSPQELLFFSNINFVFSSFMLWKKERAEKHHSLISFLSR